MTTPFQTLRTALRAADCRLECGDQFRTSYGSMVELMLVYPQGGGLVRCLVIDSGSEGYAVFIDTATATVAADVQAILATGLRSWPSLGKALPLSAPVAEAQL